MINAIGGTKFATGLVHLRCQNVTGAGRNMDQVAIGTSKVCKFSLYLHEGNHASAQKAKVS